MFTYMFGHLTASGRNLILLLVDVAPMLTYISNYLETPAAEAVKRVRGKIFPKWQKPARPDWMANESIR